jgi:hypothetical protein
LHLPLSHQVQSPAPLLSLQFPKKWKASNKTHQLHHSRPPQNKRLPQNFLAKQPATDNTTTPTFTKPAPPSSCTNFCKREREREREEGERNQKRALLEVAADLSQVFSIKSVLTRLAIFLPQLRRTEEDKGWTWWYCVPSLTEQKLTHPINGFWCTDSSSFSKFMAVVINPWHTGKNWLVICCTRMKNFRRDSWWGIALHSLVKELVTYVQQQD